MGEWGNTIHKTKPKNTECTKTLLIQNAREEHSKINNKRTTLNHPTRHPTAQMEWYPSLNLGRGVGVGERTRSEHMRLTGETRDGPGTYDG